MSARTSTSGLEDRLVEIEALLLSGATSVQLRKMAAERWHISERQAFRYVEQVLKRVGAMDVPTRHNAMQMAVYRRAMAGGKASAALGALDRMQRTESAVDVAELYSKAGELPQGDDTLQGAAWMQKIMLLSVKEIVDDRSLSSAERRDELRKTAARVAALVDFVDLDDARQRLKRRDDEIDGDRQVALARTGDDEDQGSSKAVSSVSDGDQDPIFTAPAGGRRPRGR